MIPARGQSFEDKLNIVRCFISGQALLLVVLKATTSELMGPKKKHLTYLVNITNESNVPIAKLIKYLMNRARQPEWSIAFKSLITIHYLMDYGNNRFVQNLASSSVNLHSINQMGQFSDRTNNLAHDMSIFLRRYARYISAKIQTYRTLGLDLHNIRSIDSQLSPLKLKSLRLEQLMTTLPIVQTQLDALVAFDVSPKDLSNGIINFAFSMLYKDLVHLYIAYQTAIIRLLELFFTVNQLKRAQELYDGYTKFLVRMHKVSDFMSVISCVGLDSSDMPKLSSSPDFALGLMEKHLKNLELSSKQRQLGSVDRAQSVECLPMPDCYGSLSSRSRNSRLWRRGSGRSLNSWTKSPETARPSQKRTLDCTLDKVTEELVALDKRKRESCDKNIIAHERQQMGQVDLMFMGDSHEDDNLISEADDGQESIHTGQPQENETPESGLSSNKATGQWIQVELL